MSNEELTEFEIQLLTFLDQQYQLTGQLLTADKAYEEYGIPVKDFEAAFKKSGFRDSLAERGVVFERLGNNSDSWIAKSLTPLQLLAASALLDLTDTRTNKKKLQDLGISTAKYNSWLKDPVFKNYLAERANQLIGENEHEVQLALLDRIRAGDMKAIMYYNEMTGKYVPVSSQPRPSSNPNNIDIQAILVRVIEIVNEEVNDPKEILAISTRLRSLIGANNMANALMMGEQDPIEMPEVVQTRQIPQELANGNI